jgi:membrane-associated HD superfamily phosphohydrolase
MHKLSDRELHDHYCPVRNPKSAALLVACLAVMLFVSCRSLHKAQEKPSFVLLLFLIVVYTMVARLLVAFTCFRERLLFGLVVGIVVAGEVARFVPTVFGRYIGIVRPAQLALSLLGLVVCLTMLVQSARGPDADQAKPPTMNRGQLKWKPFIALAIIVVAMLLLGTLLYFFPLR